MRLLFKLNIVKQYFRLILAAIGTSISLVSCSDEFFSGENGIAQPEGSRVIAISFGTQTRTALGGENGLTPEFQVGDEILIGNGTDKPEVCIVYDDKGSKKIRTNLSGCLTAVYPTSAAKMNGNVIEGVKVSSVQDGTFAKANICMAKMKEEDETSFSFENKTAILRFYVDKSIGVKSITIKNAGLVGDNSITVAAPEGQTLADVTDDSQKRICYVAINPGVTSQSLEITSKTVTQGDVVKVLSSTKTLGINKVYSVFMPYYVEVGDQKWGYCNIGAFLPEENGNYFSWGNSERYVFDVEWKIAQGFPGAGTVLNGGFSEDNYTKTSGYALDTDIPASTAYDAAAFWGNKWRMPTKEEFETLYSSCGGTGSAQVPTSLGAVSTKNKGIYWCTSYNGRAGLLMVNANQEQLFFPAAGYGYNTPLHGAESESIYWSSTISNTAAQAYTLHSYNQEVVPAHSDGRHICLPIRPIYTPTPTESDYVEIEAKYDGTNVTKLKWYRQNLAITDSGNKKWKGGNDSAVKVPGTNEDVIVGDYFQWGAYAGYCGDATAADKGLLIYNSFTNTKCVGVTGTDGFDFKSPEVGKTYRFNTDSDEPFVGISPHYGYDSSEEVYKYTKYTGTNEANLDLSDDVANIILGGDWRMPTSAEFQAMKDVTYWAWDDDDMGYYVFTPVGSYAAGEVASSIPADLDKSAALLFFPSAGYSLDTDLKYVGVNSFYWSSSLYFDVTDFAYYLCFSSGFVNPQTSNSCRFSGFSVRPVSD